ncbi:hypothetical protein [Paenibacillus caui]|nr:hypothetical protein [Paenibacillus caui]
MNAYGFMLFLFLLFSTLGSIHRVNNAVYIHKKSVDRYNDSFNLEDDLLR